ncbi:MAG: ATP-binding cassette domain-containing protein [Nitrososphaerota archaeon]|nr:ATP-binding cassette domain-containing protein [Nitrososphaerota archaeon]MDG7021526.1 ATP-binding cassette domain-containing protein [Nitrososphaerota archaeon]
MATIIEAEHLTKVYKGKVKAVDDISFSVEEGEIFGFLGPNGAGKSTTIKMLNTIASITSGKAVVAGHDVSRHPAKVRDVIGVVPQELTADDELKGVENILLAARLHHVRGAEAKKRAGELLKLVDLDGSAGRRVKTYSGGMRRRLQLAIGLIHTPKVLFLDEPTLGLDIQTRTKMWEYLGKLNKEQGLTIFMTTHYLEEADGLCDRIAIIDHGTIRAMGSPSQLKEKVGGDVLNIELATGPDITDFLKSIPDVSDVVKSDQAYRIKLPRAEKALPAIVEGVTRKGLEIKEISFTKPTLDEVFLEITGKSMRDEDAGESESWVQNVNAERMR